MKKITTLFMMLMLTIAAWATNYSGTLTVTVNGESTSVESTISLVDNGDGSYTLSINNFMLDGIPVGNIVVTAPGTTANGLTSIVTSETIQIAAGDPTVSEEWMGPILGDVPINMVLAFNQYAMTTNIDIYMAQLEQNINVKFAMDGEQTGYQIKNSNFENFKNNGEPFAWHGFKSATGSLVSWAKGTLASSTDVRDGATGTTSAVVTSGSTLGVVNNGTMTTGRLNAGNMSATNTANHSEMNMSNTATDANNDPFYTVMHGRPDAFTFWLKFTQGTAQSKYKYASMSAIITDGTYYQDPEDKTYTNKLATSKKTDITTCGWTQFTVPFDYIDKNIDGKALLVTFSTNATPGKGSSGDKVFIDDIALVYNAAITGISIKGSALEGFDPDVYEYNFEMAADDTFSDSDIAATYVSEHAYLVKKAIATESGYKLFVAVVSNDLNTTKVYTINYVKPEPASATLYVHDAAGAPIVDGEALSETEAGQYVNWYKVTFEKTVNDFPMTVALTSADGTETTVILNADDVKYYSFTAGAEVAADYNPYADKQITVYVRNMSDEQVAPTLYAWNDRGELNGAWAGTQMTDSEVLNDRYTWFKHTFTGVPSANVIFSLGDNTTQTTDINNLTDEVTYIKYYPYGDLDRYEIVDEPAKTTVTLAEFIESRGLIEDADRKFLADELKVEAVSASGLSATDGNGNWVLINVGQNADRALGAGEYYGACAFLVSTLSFESTVHNLKSVTLYLDQADSDLIEQAGIGEFEPEVSEYRLYAMDNDDLPEVNQAVNVIGYYKANDRGGTLRAYSANGGQHQGMSLDLLDNGNYKADMIDGHIYNVPGVLLLRSDIDFPLADGIRLMDVEDPADEMYDGVLRMMLFQLDITDTPVDNTVTGIDNINAAGIKEVKEIYNAAGQRVNTLDQHGIYILRFTDGTSAKIAR